MFKGQRSRQQPGEMGRTWTHNAASFGKDEKEIKQQIIESKHKITKVSATLILDENIPKNTEEDLRDGILKSIKDLKPDNFYIKRQNF